MTGPWSDLIHGERWRSRATMWVENGTEYSWAQAGKLACAIEEAIGDHGAVRVVRTRSDSKLGCFAGQLAAWRAGCVAAADDGSLGPDEIDHVRPDLTLAIRAGRPSTVAVVPWPDDQLLRPRIPAEVVAVNFTSGSTGSRKAVGVTRGNLLALFGCRDLDVPASDGDRPASGSFAAPGCDGWWFDTWRTVWAGGTVVCLPNANEDMLAWPELAAKYRIDRLLLPAAVIATIIEAVPGCLAGIPWVFSRGERFHALAYQKARRAGLTNRFVSLYGPTEATFATHKYELPWIAPAAAIPIGKPLAGCEQSLRAPGTPGAWGGGTHELEVSGPFVCLGYIEKGSVARLFRSRDGRPSFRTGDLVRADDDGNLVLAGRLDPVLVRSASCNR